MDFENIQIEIVKYDQSTLFFSSERFVCSSRRFSMEHFNIT